jgi:hypothetical protein
MQFTHHLSLFFSVTKITHCIQFKGYQHLADFGSSSVVDQRGFDANPDPNFHVDVDPDPDPDWHPNDAHPNAYPTQYLHMFENNGKTLLHSQQCQFTMLFLFHPWQKCTPKDFKYHFGQHIEIFWKKN